jgi:hypothetical protein
MYAKAVKMQHGIICQTNDELLSWVLDNYEKGVISKERGCHSDYVQVKHLYADWKQTPLYTDMDKKQKRVQSLQKFQGDIEANITLRSSLPIINGKQINVRNVLLGWKRREGYKCEEVEEEE